MEKKGIRHFWTKSLEECDCGCKARAFVFGRWWCIERLKEEMSKAEIDINYRGNYNGFKD